MFNFFKRKNKKKEKLNEDIVEKEIKEESDSSFSLYLLFSDAFIINKDAVIKRINMIENSKAEFQIIDDSDRRDSLYCNIKINNHKFKLIGLDTPIPATIADYTIGCGYGNKDELTRMESNKYYIIAFYEGDSKDKNEIFNVYSKLAYGFLEHNLLGVANGYSWNALTPSLIKRMVEEEDSRKLANTPAIMVWRNFIKVPYKDGSWFVTKGNNLYDVYEFAYFGTDNDTKEVYEIFENEFNCIYETKAQITAGQTIKINNGIYLKFREVYELEDVLQGEGIGTLVIEKITSNEV